jgi:hypothetical protein
MKDLLPVKVECHSGYKADEYPKCFWLDSIQFIVEEILDRWYQGESSPDFPPAHYFKVRTTDKKTYILKQETKTGNWFVWIKGESINI